MIMFKYPILETKGLDEPGLITAKKALGKADCLAKHIDTAVMLFDSRPDEELLKDCKPFFKFIGASTVLDIYIYIDKIVLAYAPLGAPAAGGLLEELIAYGIKRVLACGSSGLIGEFDSSHLLLVNKAIRDEGLSYHYMEPSLYVETSEPFTKEIEKELTKRNILFDEGITWTTDAFYRETKSRIEIRREQGAIAVEMECAGLAAVANFRNIEFAQILYFSDIVKQEGWSGFRDDRHLVKDIVYGLIVNIGMSI